MEGHWVKVHILTSHLASSLQTALGVHRYNTLFIPGLLQVQLSGTNVFRVHQRIEFLRN